MSVFEIVMPKMGESVEEATITKWFVKEGAVVKEDDILLEIATDKVDSEIPSPVPGTIREIRFEVDQVVAVGSVIAVIDTGGQEPESRQGNGSREEKIVETEDAQVTDFSSPEVPIHAKGSDDFSSGDRFFSPLVRSIAKEEGISAGVLNQLPGSGKDGRVTKSDILTYLKNRQESPDQSRDKTPHAIVGEEVKAGVEDTVIEMDRMRKLIAGHMVRSKQVSPHVTSVVEADVTSLVLWRERVKGAFGEKYGEKLTFMPLFTEAVARALRDFPGVNASVSGSDIILRREVNVGIAVSLPSGNLIVPVIKQADKKNLVGLAADINRLAGLARENKLLPDDIQGGTFTITNFGSFKNIIGTPIIHQPQVAILATGTIEKKPAVLETPTGDVIAIRHKMYLSLSYDHRVVDGALGGNFLRRVADYLEQAPTDRKI